MDKILQGDVEWAVYNYLMNNCIGEKNAISNSELSKKIFCAERTIRKAINNINSGDRFQCLIGNSNKGYWIATEKDYKIAFAREWKSVITRLKRLKNMSKKVSMNGQGKIDMETLKSEFMEVFLRGEK